MFNRHGASVVLAMMLMTGCSGAVQDMDSDDRRPAAARETPTEVSPRPSEATPPPSEATPPPVAPNTAVSPQPPVVASPAPVTPQPVAPPVMPAPTQPSMPGAASDAPSAAAGMSPSTAGATEFDAGAGTMQPDGKTVVFHIADGTGGKDWNTMDAPIRVRRGMTLHLIDDDTTKAHQLHTLGQPCSHGGRPIGMGYDCLIRDNATLGISNGAYDHNAAGGRGRIYIEVVE